MLEPTAMEVPITSSVNTAVVPVPVVHNPRARKLRSAVWQDFTKERRADGSCVAVCNHCKKQLTATSRSGTTHLRNHLAICTTTSTRRAGKRRKLIVRRILHNKTSTDGQSGDGHASGEDHDNDGTHFDQELSRRDLAHMIVQHGYRFSIVDDVGFQKFVKNLQPRFRMVSYETVRADSMTIYESEKLKLQDALLKIPCRLSISVDMWRSNTQMDFLCLTCHYIDHANDEWKLLVQTVMQMTKRHVVMNLSCYQNSSSYMTPLIEKIMCTDVAKLTNCLIELLMNSCLYNFINA
ncbi:hypothetical protein OsJ_03134 [Oryza sativa Japonica Group]|uniref:BED-type domain-containing protein n=1 Tax=Oryza sativa subsp. japonica TaxID=39947 RepID=B9EZ03_ORYSJ|nr:hypothetical protein OsJ_03134 [Oryza sativa Japonica Group]